MFTVGAFKDAEFINLQVFSGVIYLRNFIAVPFIGVEELFSLYINVTQALPVIHNRFSGWLSFSLFLFL